MSRWPDDRRAAVSLTFDNLGEAAEIQLGLRSVDEVGDHYSVAVGLPIVLAELEAAGLPATFFVEGLNASVYPEELRRIAGAGHEVAFHAWCHEEWGGLSPQQEAANLDRGLAALRALDLDVAGFRPPGGLIGPTTTSLLKAHGVRYCSPAGSASGRRDGIVLLPFSWLAVDVLHVLPQFAGLRARLTGTEDPGGPDAARGAMLAAIDAATASGGHAVLVFHNWIAEHERPQLHDVLATVADRAASGDLWVARCDKVAAWIAGRSEHFEDAPQLDHRSWQSPT
jgi:peptidoglycan/xylan/chitin deacetylase (PgdA/CDA1 family)